MGLQAMASTPVRTSSWPRSASLPRRRAAYSSRLTRRSQMVPILTFRMRAPDGSRTRPRLRRRLGPPVQATTLSADERDLPRVQLVDDLAATSLALDQISDSLTYPAQREGLVDNCCHLAGLHELPHDLQVPAVLASNSASVTAGRAAATRSTSCSIPSLRCLSSLHPTDWLEPLESGLVDSGGIKHASQCSVR